MQEKQNNTGLIWFRNNLRTQDNSSLKKAIDNHKKVIAIFFLIQKTLKKRSSDLKKLRSLELNF